METTLKSKFLDLLNYKTKNPHVNSSFLREASSEKTKPHTHQNNQSMTLKELPFANSNPLVTGNLIRSCSTTGYKVESQFVQSGRNHLFYDCI